MNVLKGLATGSLSFLLMVSLSVFGIALLINCTLLNPGFIAGQVEKLDMNAVARDVVKEQLEQELPQEAKFLEDAAYDVTAEQEPWLKEQANNAIYAVYDHLLANSG